MFLSTAPRSRGLQRPRQVPVRKRLPKRLGNLFASLQALNVVFEKMPENDSADVCRSIAVNVLDCDTIGQAKEKIFQAFLSKNGAPYGLQLNEICLGKAPRPLVTVPPPSLPPSRPPALTSWLCPEACLWGQGTAWLS